MTRPLIGITTYPPSSGGRFNLPAEYVEAVRRAGADAVLLPPGTAGLAADGPSLVGRLDGVVLSGGGDLDPATYGGDGHETIYALDPERDAGELELARWLVERDVPTLAICRGHQVVNVALGGTLFAHLPDVVGTEVLHRIEPPVLRERATPTPHPVTVDADSRLAVALGATDVVPVSWHHQSVDRLGDGLRVVATAPDGTIEAVEHADHPQLVSVQWHPELSAATDPTQQALFNDLVRRCQHPTEPLQRREKEQQ